MDSFLQKFSLQNLLRQFFCGVVFFVPLYLFAREKMPATDLLKWESGVFFLFSSVALAVGTIIYHLEKNLYSYPLMYMYERFIFHNKKEDSSREVSPFNWWLIWCIAGVVCLLVLGWGHCVSWPWPAFIVLAIFWLFIVTRMLLESSEEMIVEQTKNQWKIEYEASLKTREHKLLNKLENISTQYAAAEKIATWSDFIHCVQSCCFAWIFGSLLAFYLTETIVKGFYQGLTAAFVLLAAEMIIDMHRYRFVRKMVPADAKEAENGGGGDNHEQQKDREEKIDAEGMINASEIENSPAEQVLPECRKRPDSNYAMSKSPQDGTKRCFFNLDMDKLQKVIDGVYIFDFEICEESQLVRKMWCAPSVVLRDYCESILKKINRQEGPLSYSLYIDYQTGAVYDALNAPHEQMLFFLAPITNGSSFALVFKSFK